MGLGGALVKFIVDKRILRLVESVFLLERTIMRIALSIVLLLVIGFIGDIESRRGRTRSRTKSKVKVEHSTARAC